MSSLRVSNIHAGDRIRTCTNFQGSNFGGFLRPMDDSLIRFTGRLSDDLVTRIRAQKPFYVVYSYATPIAWAYLNDRGVTTWEIPSIRYSQSTSRHQSLVRNSLTKVDNHGN